MKLTYPEIEGLLELEDRITEELYTIKKASKLLVKQNELIEHYESILEQLGILPKYAKNIDEISITYFDDTIKDIKQVCINFNVPLNENNTEE